MATPSLQVAIESANVCQLLQKLRIVSLLWSMRGLPAFGIRVLLCTALFSLGIFVDAYSIPFSFSDSADIVNKVCLYPCGEVGLEKGTKVTVDVTLSNANAGPEGDCIPQIAPHLLSEICSIRGFKTHFFRCLHIESIHRPTCWCVVGTNLRSLSRNARFPLANLLLLMLLFAGPVRQKISAEWSEIHHSFSSFRLFVDFVHYQPIESILFRFSQLPIAVPCHLLRHAVLRQHQRSAACVRSDPSYPSSRGSAFFIPNCAFVVDFSSVFCAASYSTFWAQQCVSHKHMFFHSVRQNYLHWTWAPQDTTTFCLRCLLDLESYFFPDFWHNFHCFGALCHVANISWLENRSSHKS